MSSIKGTLSVWNDCGEGKKTVNSFVKESEKNEIQHSLEASDVKLAISQQINLNLYVSTITSLD